MKPKAIFNWSGGKDSSLALYKVMQEGHFDIRHLLTSLNTETDRISMHGVRRSMLEAQVNAMGFPLTLLELPGHITMEEYDQLMHQKMEPLLAEGISHSIFGDIFLEDLKAYRDERLAAVGLEGHYPIWKQDTAALVEEFVAAGFKAIVVSIDGSKLDRSFAGRELDMDFVNDLPTEVDPCGENGEFHSFVYAGPIFKEEFDFKRGEVVGKSYRLSTDSDEEVTYWFQDLIPNE